MKKKIALLMFSTVLVVLSAIPAFADGVRPVFSDLPDTHWAAAQIYDLVGRKWLSGYPDDTFLPDQKVTRAELAAMIAKAAGKSQPQQQQPSFSDVSGDNWFYAPVTATSEFFSRDSSLEKGLFRPEDPATRQEATAAIALAVGLTDSDPAGLGDAFSDYEGILPEYRGIIATAIKEKIIKGYPGGTFGPDGSLTRAEATVMLSNAFLKGDQQEKETDSGQSSNLKNVLDAMPLQAFTETRDQFKPLLDNLEGLSIFDMVNLEFFIDELAPQGEGKDKKVVVFARVDPFKYSTFSDGIFKSDSAKVGAHAEKIAIEASKGLPGRKVVAVIGYTNLNFNTNAPDIFGSAYTSYSPEEDGWRVKRFYSAAEAQDGSLSDTWVDQARAGNS